MRTSPPYDTTPELLILHKFRELQIKGMEQQNRKLQQVAESRDRLDRYANTDELTGIANRRGFWSMGAGWLNEHADSCKALLVTNISRFKVINEKYGHDAGDALLQIIGQRFNEALQVIGVGGRIGGDEFVALVNAADLTQLKERVNAIARTVAQPVVHGECVLSAEISTGAVIVEDNPDLDELIGCANLAIYDGGRGQHGEVSWYTPEIRRKSEYDKKLTLDFESTLEAGLISPVYQPIVRLSDNKHVSFEVLARWDHPELGMISPQVFIQLAEKAGLLRKLDSVMLELSLDQLAMWREQGKDYSVHVNICGPSIHSGLPATVLDNLAKRNLSPDSLILELTETTLIDDSAAAKAILNELTNSGVSLHLDDFGTGYSSLTHLQDFPVSGVKIDRSFVDQAPVSKRARNLLFAVADIASHLDLSLVGEGIETEEQLNLLMQMGCHYGQGYLLGKPAKAPDCEQLLISDVRKAA